MVGTSHGHALSKIRALRAMAEFEFAVVCRPDPNEPADSDELRDVQWVSLEQIAGDAPSNWWSSSRMTCFVAVRAGTEQNRDMKAQGSE